MVFIRHLFAFIHAKGKEALSERGVCSNEVYYIPFYPLQLRISSCISIHHGKKLSPRLRFQTSPVGNTISSFSFSFATTFSPLPSFWSKSMYISSFVFPTSLVWISQYRMVFPGYANTSSGVTTFLPRHPLPFSNGTGSYPLKTPFLVISRGHPGWFGSANDPENLSSKDDDDDARLSAGEKKSEQQHETTRTAFSVLSLNELALRQTLRLNSVLLSRLLVLEFPKRRLFVVVSAAPADVKEDAVSIVRLNWKKV